VAQWSLVALVSQHGGMASGTLVEAGGLELVISGGQTFGTTVSGPNTQHELLGVIVIPSDAPIAVVAPFPPRTQRAVRRPSLGDCGAPSASLGLQIIDFWEAWSAHWTASDSDSQSALAVRPPSI
jgi:autotransporter passenger strand-loop-strand repeat protein